MNNEIPIPPADSAETTILVGQAEPGHDVFAGVPHDELKSKEQPAGEAVHGEKEISSVEVPQPTTQSGAFQGVPPPPVENKPLGVGDQPSSSDEVLIAKVVAEDQAEATKSQGAQVEEEAEADRVRDELFPEAELD